MKKSTKDKILLTTFLLLLEKGYDRVKVGDIQEKLGIARGLPYKYFKNKSELIFAACRKFFYDRHFQDVDYDKITLLEFIDRVESSLYKMTHTGGIEVEMLKYNTLYSAMIQHSPEFKTEAQLEFGKAMKVIHNAVERGEIRRIPENFIGATILAILGRTSYITKTPSNEYICRRMMEDVRRFYDLIKSQG